MTRGGSAQVLLTHHQQQQQQHAGVVAGGLHAYGHAAQTHKMPQAAAPWQRAHDASVTITYTTVAGVGGGSTGAHRSACASTATMMYAAPGGGGATPVGSPVPSAPVCSAVSASPLPASSSSSSSQPCVLPLAVGHASALLLSPSAVSSSSATSASVSAAPGAGAALSAQEQAALDRAALALVLHEAARYGDADTLERILLVDEREDGLDVDARNEHGQTPLHVASRLGHVAAVDVLIRGGAHLYALQAEDGLAPLHLAVINEHFDTVRRLLQYGAYPYQLSGRGQTVIDMVLCEAIVELLFEFYTSERENPCLVARMERDLYLWRDIDDIISASREYESFPYEEDEEVTCSDADSELASLGGESSSSGTLVATPCFPHESMPALVL